MGKGNSFTIQRPMAQGSQQTRWAKKREYAAETKGGLPRKNLSKEARPRQKKVLKKKKPEQDKKERSGSSSGGHLKSIAVEEKNER